MSREEGGTERFFQKVFHLDAEELFELITKAFEDTSEKKFKIKNMEQKHLSQRRTQSTTMEQII